MRLHRLLPFCFALVFATGLRAQDNLYTLHDMAPLWLNAANTGAFAGSVRVGGIYRGQWYSINGIQSPTAYLDAPLPFALRKQDWIGVGLSLVNSKQPFNGMNDTDESPVNADITENFFGFSAAYHLSLDKKRTNILTLGAQYGSISYGGEFAGVLDQEGNIASAPGFQTEGFNEFQPTGNNMGSGGSGQGNNNRSVNDLNVGLKLKLLLDKKKENVFEGGVTMLHLTSPERRPIFMREGVTNPPDSMGMNPINPGNGPRELRERKPAIHAHARLDLEMSEKWRLQPTAVFLQSSRSSFVSAQVWGQRNLRKDLDLRLGVGYRTGDAAQLLFGLDFEQIKTAISYDLTVNSNSRQVTNYQGAFEISAQYIFNIYKKPEVVPTILCPDI
ncbi:type IX secretion system membrane protein PorP/SprF [Lewinella sp. 4G2]|uniref:type IX secretion system membrane protein PorP/SprF n=1 Tax=Lewinella sp. 4G2 TaxID=1803372 RepID=UPI0012FBF308|nr:type IX secretion system membrane protein PorP/SprF [Lewinella sp. 4G2]